MLLFYRLEWITRGRRRKRRSDFGFWFQWCSTLEVNLYNQVFPSLVFLFISCFTFPLFGWALWAPVCFVNLLVFLLLDCDVLTLHLVYCWKGKLACYFVFVLSSLMHLAVGDTDQNSDSSAFIRYLLMVVDICFNCCCFLFEFELDVVWCWK